MIYSWYLNTGETDEIFPELAEYRWIGVLFNITFKIKISSCWYSNESLGWAESNGGHRNVLSAITIILFNFAYIANTLKMPKSTYLWWLGGPHSTFPIFMKLYTGCF